MFGAPRKPKRKYVPAPDSYVEKVPFFAYRVEVFPQKPIMATYYLGPWDDARLAEIMMEREADELEKRGVSAFLKVQRSESWEDVG